MAFITPIDWSRGVEGTFDVVTPPSESATRSVNAAHVNPEACWCHQRAISSRCGCVFRRSVRAVSLTVKTVRSVATAANIT